MNSRSITALLLLTLIFCLNGCDSHRETPPAVASNLKATPPSKVAPPPQKQPFQEPIEPLLYELPSGALAIWRDFDGQRPTLILFSSHPLLTPLQESNREELRQFLLTGESREIVRRGRYWSADPAVTSPQTVSAAIAAGLFSEIVFVMPTKMPPEDFALGSVREQTQSAAFLTKSEAHGLTLQEHGVIGGKVRGVPLRVVHPERLPKIAGPVVIHVDLGYFNGLYINEVKTPSYDLLHELAIRIQEKSYPTLAATLSFSNQEVGFSLESRFLIRDLADILRNPKLLEGGTPASWSLRAGALYATTMFSEGNARDLIQKAVAATPDDAAAHYALALDLFEQRHNERGFAALDQAVRLDSGYALEYFHLAERALELGQRDKAIELLGKAVMAMPEVDFLRLQLANHLIQAGRGREAVPIVAELKGLKWSATIHPGVTSLLEEMQQVAKTNPLPRQIDTSTGQKESHPGPQGSRMPGFNHMMMGNPGH